MNEHQTCLVAGETMTNADIGPATANGFGDAAMILGNAARLSAVSQNLVLTLPCPGSRFTSDPPQIATQQLADGGLRYRRLHCQSFLPGGESQERKAISQHGFRRAYVAGLILGCCQMNSG